MEKVITHKQKRRMYKLHYHLKKKGNKVSAKERMVIKRQKIVSKIENKYCNELIAFGYGICDDMFNSNKIFEITTFKGEQMQIIVGRSYGGEGYSGITDGKILTGELLEVDQQANTAIIFSDTHKHPCSVKLKSLFEL